MEDKKTEQPVGLHDGIDIQEEITKTIRQAFQLFADHNKQMSEDLVAFNKKQAEVREKLKSGANRTTGHIV